MDTDTKNDRNKWGLWLVLILVLVGLGIYFFSNREEKLSYEVAAGLEIKEFSLEGTIISKDDDSVVIETGRVERAVDGNKLVKYQKTITFLPQVQFHTKLRPEMIEAEILSAEASISKLRAGDTAVFYGTGSLDLASSDAVVATKVELIGLGSAQ